MLDPGNGLWAMEDPMMHLQGTRAAVVCSLRDYMVWVERRSGRPSAKVDVRRKTLAKANPGMPMFVESISNSARSIPFLTDEHWQGYPKIA